MGMMDMLNPVNAAKKAVGVAKKAPGMQQMGKAVGKFAPPGLNKAVGALPGIGPSNNPMNNPNTGVVGPMKNPTGMQGGGFMGGQPVNRMMPPPDMNVPPPVPNGLGEMQMVPQLEPKPMPVDGGISGSGIQALMAAMQAKRGGVRRTPTY